MTDPRGEAPSEGLALPLEVMEVGAMGWCVVDANQRVLGYAMNQKQAEQLAAPFAASATAPLPANARAVAEKCLDILCASLHEAEAEGHDLPACVSLAWSEVTMIQTTTLPDAPQPASVEIPQGLSEIGRRNWLIGYWKERAEKAEMPLELPLSETPPSGTAKPTGSWRPFKAMEKSAHWTVIDENHNTLFTCWRGEIDARRICELHTLHTSAASPDGNEEKGK